MEGVSVDGRNGKLIQSVAEMIVRFHGDVFPKLAEWEQRLKADPQILDRYVRQKSSSVRPNNWSFPRVFDPVELKQRGGRLWVWKLSVAVRSMRRTDEKRPISAPGTGLWPLGEHSTRRL